MEPGLDAVHRDPERDGSGLDVLVVDQERVGQVVHVDQEASRGRVSPLLLEPVPVPAERRDVFELDMPQLVTEHRPGLPARHRRFETDDRKVMDVLPESAPPDRLAAQLDVRQLRELLPRAIGIPHRYSDSLLLLARTMRSRLGPASDKQPALSAVLCTRTGESVTLRLRKARYSLELNVVRLHRTGFRDRAEVRTRDREPLLEVIESGFEVVESVDDPVDVAGRHRFAF